MVNAVHPEANGILVLACTEFYFQGIKNRDDQDNQDRRMVMPSIPNQNETFVDETHGILFVRD